MEQPNLRPFGIVPAPGATGTTESQSKQLAETGGPAFEAVLSELLERVQAQTRQIKETSKTLEDPRGLPDAMGVARESLDDAVRLGDRLLEAYREARQQGTAEEAHDDTNGNTTHGDKSWK